MRPTLLALEKNILKYRALQMLLLLHQVESLRVFVISSIRATDTLGFAASKTVNRLPNNTKRPMEKALAILVQDGVVTQNESEDIQAIIDIRNRIGHRIHELIQDVSAPGMLGLRDPVYDYFALERFERYREKISSGMSKSFVLQLDLLELSFEQAEATYKEELVRLRRRIDRQFEVRRRGASH